MVEIILNCGRRYKRFFRYAAIGCTGASLDFFVFLALRPIAGTVVANVISVSLGITNNFFLNAWLNFRVSNQMFVRFLRFFLTGLLGMLISTTILYVGIDVLLFPQLPVKLLTIALVTMMQYVINSRWALKKEIQ